MKHEKNQGWFRGVFNPRNFFIAVLLGLLTACAPHQPCDQYVGRSHDLCLLRKAGVSVLKAGETVKIILPSDSVFINDTPEIRDHYKPVLSVMADFIRTFSTISVKVAAFTNPTPQDFKTKGGESLSTQLTKAQADAVSRYLWRHCVNARLLYAVGGNGHDPVAWHGSRVGRWLNRRVEVTFRYYRDNTAWY